MKIKFKLEKFNTKALREARDKAIERTAGKSIRIVKSEINKRQLVNTGELRDSVGVTIKRNGFDVDVNADYAGILNEGVKRHKMRYLVDAGPIPIVVKKGVRIFRVANSKNITKKGKWMHPGFKRGKGFFDISADKITDECTEILSEELSKV